MKILIYTDNHFCQNSSIVSGRGEMFSHRLENQIATLNWVEQLARERGCSMIINAGDFFTRPDLNSEEVSALKMIKWSEHIWHFFLVGNHDASDKSLFFNVQNVFSFIENADVIDHTCVMGDENFVILFVPYISQTSTEEDIQLDSLIGDVDIRNAKKVLMISHNDIKGVQFGGFISKTGLSIDDIEAHCDLCINGHLHNHTWVTKKILNLGNVTGQNFSEDAERYPHYCAVVDTDTLQCDLIVNPHALNFYKIDLTTRDFDWNVLNSNSVVTVKCQADAVESVRALLAQRQVRYSRVLVDTETKRVDQAQTEAVLSIDHHQRFRDFILSNVGDTDLIKEELSIICEG